MTSPLEYRTATIWDSTHPLEPQKSSSVPSQRCPARQSIAIAPRWGLSRDVDLSPLLPRLNTGGNTGDPRHKMAVIGSSGVKPRTPRKCLILGVYSNQQQSAANGLRSSLNRQVGGSIPPASTISLRSFIGKASCLEQPRGAVGLLAFPTMLHSQRNPASHGRGQRKSWSQDVCQSLDLAITHTLSSSAAPGATGSRYQQFGDTVGNNYRLDTTPMRGLRPMQLENDVATAEGQSRR